MRNLITISLGLILLISCGREKTPLPKPPTYLRQNLPDHKYHLYVSGCSYNFLAPAIFTITDIEDPTKNTCHKDINLGPLNGVMHLSFLKMKEPLASYINYANDKVDEHKLKATAIEDKNFINKEDRVFGTLFELQGDVASPFQFYLTDSTSKFVSGVVYFNSRPNYDSLKPTLDYLKIDLLKMIESFKWK